MLVVLGKFLGSLIRSIFISAVMFLIVLSVLTGDFPPNMEKIKNTYAGLQKMSELSQKFQHPPAPTQGSEEADVLYLEQINKQRQQAGQNLLGGSAPTTVVASGSEDQELKATIRELQRQVFKLQNRVAELEEKSASGKSK